MLSYLKKYLFIFMPLILFGLAVKFVLALIIIFFSFLGITSDGSLVPFQEWIYEYSLFLVGGAKFLVLFFFYQFSALRKEGTLFDKKLNRWNRLFNNSSQIHKRQRTSIIIWPVFLILLFCTYFWLYPISFSSQNLTNWDDALAGYFYCSLYLFLGLLSGYLIISPKRWICFVHDKNKSVPLLTWIDFFIMGFLMAAMDWFCFPVDEKVFSVLWFFYSLSFMHFWRQQNLQLFFFSFIFFSVILVFFSPLQLFPSLPTEVWSINVNYHPLPFVLPMLLLYVLLGYGLKLGRKLFF